MRNIFDLIIIGLGTAGLQAAKRGVEAGFKVLAFEKDKIGGCCLNKGCIPTKTVLHSSYIFNMSKNQTNPQIPDLTAIKAKKDKIINLFLNAAKKDLIAKNVKIINENAVMDFKNMTVNGVEGRNIIIASGSVPFEVPNLPFDHKNILSSDDVLNLDTIPKSIAIIGSGAIGIEWASIFSNFGADVTLIEKASCLLPSMDLSVQKRIERIFKTKNIKFYKEKTAAAYKNGILELNDGTKIKAEKILAAIGRKRVLPDGLRINPDLSTNFKNVYAIGDIAAKKMLAHTANMHGAYIIDKIAGKNPHLASDIEIPSIVYGSPEIASAGINEQDLNSNGEFEIVEKPVSFLPKSWCDNQTEGFIKLIIKDELLLGAHIVSNEASSLILALQIMIKHKIPVNMLKDIVFAHPTYSEGIYEALFNR